MDSAELTMGSVKVDRWDVKVDMFQPWEVINLCRGLRCISLKWTMGTEFHLAQQPTPRPEDCKVDICGYAESEVSRIRHDRGLPG